MTERCKSCISKRLNGGKIYCSLGCDEYLDGEVCGNFESGKPTDDFKFEFNGIHIDQVNENWLEGKEV